MQTTNHILEQEGILTTFSIAKKVTAKDIKKLREKMKLEKMDSKKFQELLRETTIKQSKKDFDEQKIPGLIVDTSSSSSQKKRIMELTYFASVISKKMSDKNIDKYHLCYIINAMVNMLHLTEEDFDSFHKKFSKFKGENGEKIENDDDNDDEIDEEE